MVINELQGGHVKILSNLCCGPQFFVCGPQFAWTEIYAPLFPPAQPPPINNDLFLM